MYMNDSIMKAILPVLFALISWSLPAALDAQEDLPPSLWWTTTPKEIIKEMSRYHCKYRNERMRDPHCATRMQNYLQTRPLHGLDDMLTSTARNEAQYFCNFGTHQDGGWNWLARMFKGTKLPRKLEDHYEIARDDYSVDVALSREIGRTEVSWRKDVVPHPRAFADCFVEKARNALAYDSLIAPVGNAVPSAKLRSTTSKDVREVRGMSRFERRHPIHQKSNVAAAQYSFTSVP